MEHVFITYTRSDQDFAASVTRQIEGAGFRVWMDNERLHGDTWREAIDQAIRDAFAVIVILTPAARQSEQIMYECMFALGVGVTVIPLIRQPVDVPSRLEALTSLDFTDDALLPWGRLIRLVHEAQPADRRPPRRPASGDRPRADDAPPATNSLLRRVDRPRPTGERPSFFAARRSPSDAPLFGSRDRDRTLDRDGDPSPPAPPGSGGDAPSVERLLRSLEHSSRDVRLSAARQLGDAGTKRAIPALINLLRDEDWRVREAAASALGKLKATASVVALLEVIQFGRSGPFSGGNTTAFMQAIREIGPAAVPVLIDALSDDDWRMRLTIINLLGDIGDTDAVPVLVGMLRDAEWRVRWRAADALGRLADATAAPDLLALLHDDMRDVRVSAAWALGKIGHATAVSGLVRLLHDHEWRVRWAAAEALWHIGPDAVPALVDTLRAPDDYVRRAAIRALAMIGEPAIPALIVVLADSNWDTRWAAASALQEIGPPAVDDLIAALDASRWQAAWAAAETLKRIGTTDALNAVEGWRHAGGVPDDFPDDDDPADIAEAPEPEDITKD